MGNLFSRINYHYHLAWWCFVLGASAPERSSHTFDPTETGLKELWNIPPPKGAVVVVNIHLREVSKTKLKNADGQIISCSFEEITSPPLSACIVISTHMLATPSYRNHYVQTALAEHNIDQSTSDYLAPRIISHALELIAPINGRDNDTSYEIDVGLIVTRVEIIDEKHLFGRLKEEVFEVGDGKLSCGVCLEELERVLWDTGTASSIEGKKFKSVKTE
ncbi:hypothetical protein LguiA_018113 [Lonicera macranthoides]